MKIRLKLENLIFFRAALLRTSIWSKQGALVTSCTDDLLIQLIALYNRFFALENACFFEEEKELLWGAYYAKQSPFWGGLIPWQEWEIEKNWSKHLEKLRCELEK